jgi:DNA anti-recombination protein RmuC
MICEVGSRSSSSLRRQENQSRNVMEVAKRGVMLYDKLCGFVEDLQDVGKRVQPISTNSIRFDA